MTDKQKREKVKKLQTMVSSITDVSDKINSTTSSKKRSTYTCSTYIDMVTYFASICDKIKNFDEILTLASLITSATVTACSSSEISSLSILYTLLQAIIEILEQKIEKLLSGNITGCVK